MVFAAWVWYNVEEQMPRNGAEMECFAMQVYVYKNAELAAKAAATVFASQLLKKPDSVFGFATGSTPIPMYQELIRLNKEGIIDFSQCRTWNLDEYVGLTGDHPCSYRYFMNEQLFNHINIKMENTHVPCGVNPDMDKEAADYDAAIFAAGGIDVQLLGIGHNGHIGFNEPADTFIFNTHVMDLTESTIDANARFFNNRDEVPRHAISMGIGNIMLAKRIVMIATGKGKAEAIRGSIKGDADPKNQASILRFHQDVQYFLDEEAASLL